MLTLRFTQHPKQGDTYSIDLSLEEPGQPPQSASASVQCELDVPDQERLRWYLEDFLKYPFDPAPKMAAGVEQRMEEIGQDLFRQLFEADRGTQRVWDKMSDRLSDCRMEITTGVPEAAALPWELLRDPLTNDPLALQAPAFVRAQTETTRRMALPQLQAGEPIRILLVICRPGGRDDVPFRSVARRLLGGLTEEAQALFNLNVLRPPTYQRLSEVLRQAKAEGQPYHILHFDGHGAYFDLEEAFEAWEDQADDEILKELAELLHLDPHQFSPQALYPEAPRGGGHGYLAFENPDSVYNLRLVDGPKLGTLLAETGVPVLVLNACRSAHAETSAQDQSAIRNPQSAIHSQVRAFGSLAQEVVDAGVPGVVAMRYNVYVDTAAQFVANLYAALAQGYPLGEAVTYSRKQLHAQPLRRYVGEPRPLQDWPVPVVYEAAPLALFPRAAAAPLQIRLERGSAPAAPKGIPGESDLPFPPDIGFWGRDETVMALDRAFDTQRVALLHGFAGCGKTATAAELARWYVTTGGLGEGVVFFTSFAQHLPLARALDRFGAVFDPLLQADGIHWLALDDAQRRQVALEVMRQVPILWIWDNVEPVTGFPAGTPSQWSAAEQRELADFLHAAQGTKARFLLTSRRDERAWLGDLPRRVQLPPMPREERIQMAQALAAKHGVTLDVPAWRPLLEFTDGNPLTLTVVVGQALRDGLRKEEQITAYVAQLRAGQVDFAADETEQGRDKSLAASLSYGFAHAFTEDDRRILALLHLFQGFVDVDALKWMGNPEEDHCLDSVRGLTRERGIALLDRAAEIGLLAAHGGGTYAIHPALPWFFRKMYERYYPEPANQPTSQPANHAIRAFVEALGELGNYYTNQYIDGNRDVIAALRAEEANLRHARALARQFGWRLAMMKAMQGLYQLYGHTGRRAAWQALVEEIVPDFVDPATDGPLPGREEQWSLVTQYRVLLAIEARDWAEAERLQRAQVEWTCQRAAPALALPPDRTDDAQRNALRTLAVSLEQLGHILREQSKPECIQSYEEAIPLYQRIGDHAAEAVAAFNLGHAYKNLPTLRDLDQAEQWYRRSLDLFGPRDRLGRGKCYNGLGLVAYERFKEARESGKPEEELLRHINDAAHSTHQALALLPPDAVDDLAVAHHQLGVIYNNAGDLERALHHYNEGIRYFETAGDFYHAGQNRFNVAVALTQRGRFEEALLYACAALRNFESYEGRAAEDEQKTRELMEEIERIRREA